MSESGLAAPVHKPVMLEETVAGWFGDPQGLYVDGTFGRGGHSRLLLSKLAEAGKLLVLDRDAQAIAEAKRLQGEDSRVLVEHAAFADMAEKVSLQGWTGKVSGILLDLGVSSPQLDTPERGFSFMRDGPLDMRMDTTSGQSAAEWLAVAEFAEIANVLREYGEEKFAGRIAKAVVEQRENAPIDTTFKLVELIDRVVPKSIGSRRGGPKRSVQKKEQGKHRATRTFQAIRIFVNRELEQLELFLRSCNELLAPGGRLAVISFHSLEDRIVKRFMRTEARGDDAPKRLPVRDSELNRRMKIVVRSCRASEKEVEDNPRARSAVLRVAEKLG